MQKKAPELVLLDRMSEGEKWDLAIHGGVSGLDSIETPWNDLYRVVVPRRFFHAFDWYRCFLEHLPERPEDVLFLVGSHTRGEISAILPLERIESRRLGVRVRELRLPAHAHAPLKDIVAATVVGEEMNLDSLVARLRRTRELEWDVMALEPVLRDSCALRAFSPAGGWGRVLEHYAYCSFIPLGDLGAVFAGLSKNFRSNLSRARNKLRAMESVELERTVGSRALDRAFDEFLDVEAAGWKGREGTGSAIKLHPELVAFYRGLLERFGRRGACEVAILRAEGRAIAGQFALLVDDTVYQLKIGYDEKYARLAPGNMLMERLLEAYAGDGYRCFHLVSYTDWHRNWRAERDDLYSLYVCNLTWRGVLLSALLRLRKLLRPVYRALFRRARA